MAINYDVLTRGLIKTKVRVTKPLENFVWAQNVLFGNPSIGTEQDYIDYSAQFDTVCIPEEAVKGLDPRRVNYGAEFSSHYIASQYYFEQDTVDLAAAENRLFNEPITEPWSVERRQLELAAVKRDAIAQSFRIAKEKLAWECALNGKFTTRNNGEQTFPMSSDMLSIAGANFIAKPFETLNAVAKILFQKGVTLKRVVLNPTDGAALAASTAWQTMLDKKRVNIGEIAPASVDSNGLSKVGTIVGLICGPVDIYIYAGFYSTRDANSGIVSYTEYLPQGKALLLPGSAIGRFGYTGLLVDRNGIQGKAAMSETYMTFAEKKGALVSTFIQGQTAPAPILDSVDHYGVMTGITA
jgi:hypothetical protein